MAVKTRCVIIGAAPLREGGHIHLRGLIDGADYIICADGGYAAAARAGITPDLYIGDGDSHSGAGPDLTAEKIILPREKDLTDFHAAVNRGLSLGFRDFLLLCCTGGRFDHHYANICMLEHIAKNSADAAIADENNYIMLHSGGLMNLKKKPGFKYLSVAALDEKITGVTLKGLKYPLCGATLLRSEPMGISNEFTADEASVGIKTGRALVIYGRD